ncbi:prefoldin subunit 3 [Sorex araneus]|uniref:prefoldin subunit 3 n=1 Tax=Sorex araneus TaxID=42254 RepID=UPI0024335034|nr:prefoldin subunit 3 [Sorex araneus]
MGLVKLKHHFKRQTRTGTYHLIPRFRDEAACESSLRIEPFSQIKTELQGEEFEEVPLEESLQVIGEMPELDCPTQTQTGYGKIYLSERPGPGTSRRAHSDWAQRPGPLQSHGVWTSDRRSRFTASQGTSQSRAPGGGRSGGGQSRARFPNMAVAKDGGGFGGGAAGNGRRLHLGIPEAVFVEDVDNFMKQPGNETADVVLKKLDEQYQKYKFMELNLAQKKRRLKNQIPEIKQTLEILKYMQKKKESTNSMETRFLLADNLYCKASVPPTDKVCLWLGANVMLEYDIDEAQALLEKNLSTATKNLDSLEEDLDFLRDQFTTTEVNMARVYNWDVKRRNKDDPTKNKA